MSDLLIISENTKKLQEVYWVKNYNLKVKSYLIFRFVEKTV